MALKCTQKLRRELVNTPYCTLPLGDGHIWLLLYKVEQRSPLTSKPLSFELVVGVGFKWSLDTVEPILQPDLLATLNQRMTNIRD